jgi:hypothetical protein
MSIWDSIRRLTDNTFRKQNTGIFGNGKKDAQKRQLQIEQFEDRILLSINSPELNAIFVNQDETQYFDPASTNETYHIAPESFLLRFNEGQNLDPATLGTGIQIVRAGTDGTFGTNDDINVNIGWIGLNGSRGDGKDVVTTGTIRSLAEGIVGNEIIIRFSETLPDDLYQIRLIGSELKNLQRDEFHDGQNQTVSFELDLGAHIIATVPQPTYRNSDGSIGQARDQIVLYFNVNDPLNFPSTTTNPNYLKLFQLIATQNTADSSDDIVYTPSKIDYVASEGKMTLTFSGGDIANLPGFGTANNAARLRVGNFYAVTETSTLDLNSVDPGDAFHTSFSLAGEFDTTAAVSAPQSLIIHGQVNPKYDPIEYPGASDEPGHSDLPINYGFDGENGENSKNGNTHVDGDTIGADKDTTDGPSIQYYNFKEVIGYDSNGAEIRNEITPEQKNLARQIFQLYSRYLGIQFIEDTDTENPRGTIIATGNLQSVAQWYDPIDNHYISRYTSAAGGDKGLYGKAFTLTDVNDLTYSESGELLLYRQALTGENIYLTSTKDVYPLVVMDSSETWGANIYGGNWFVTAMQQIGYSIGLSGAYDLVDGAVMGGSGYEADQLYPDDYDIIHGQYEYRPDSNDVDLYKFEIAAGQRGMFSAEIYAQRQNATSLLDATITLYKQVKATNGTITYETVARNDNYFGKDSFLEMYLTEGTYFIGVAASGNDRYNPEIENSGEGGTTSGTYELRLNFTPGGVDPNDVTTYKATAGSPNPVEANLVDATGIKFDGDHDGTPGGVYDFWFNVQTENKTIYVDKIAQAGGDGSLARPYNTIQAALNVAKEGDIVRIVGNNYANDTENLTDNLAYEIGQNKDTKAVLSDGATFDIPRGVTILIDEGAILKFAGTNINVGSFTQGVDRSGGSIQVLGTPEHSVIFTSYYDQTVGTKTNVLNTVATAGDWGGISIRNDLDYAFIASYDPSLGKKQREVLEEQGIFLNYINHADFRYGGGTATGTTGTYAPVNMTAARPTVSYNKITNTRNAALSADITSFEETRFQSWDHDANTAYTLDYTRIGPDIYGNTIVSNAINGLMVRAQTTTDTTGTVQKVTGYIRFDDTDVVHVMQENIIIAGSIGEYQTTSVTAPSLSVRNDQFPDATHNVPIDTNNDVLYDNLLSFNSVPADGEYFTLSDGTTSLTFEFNHIDKTNHGGVVKGRVQVDINSTDNLDTVRTKLITVINALGNANYIDNYKIYVPGSVTQNETVLRQHNTSSPSATITNGNTQLVKPFKISADTYIDVYNVTFELAGKEIGSLVLKNDQNGSVDVHDGDSFTMDGQEYEFNVDNQNGVKSGRIAIDINSTDNITTIVSKIRNKVERLAAVLTLTPSSSSASATYANKSLTLRNTPEDGFVFVFNYTQNGYDYQTEIEFNCVDKQTDGIGVQPGRIQVNINSTDSIDTVVQELRNTLMMNGISVNAEWITTTSEVHKTIQLSGTGTELEILGTGLVKANSAGRMMIDPGVIFKSYNARMETEIGAQLLAEGTVAHPIVLTSLYDTRYGAGGTYETYRNASSSTQILPNPANWSGIYFGPDSSGSIDHAVIAFAGGSSAAGGNNLAFNPVEIQQADVRIADSRFEYNTGTIRSTIAGTAGNIGYRSATPSVIFVRGAQPILVNNEFFNNTNGLTNNPNALSVISINANSLNDESVIDWGRSTGPISNYSEYNDNYGALVRNNRFTGNSINGMVVRGETLTVAGIWDDADIAHILYNEIRVPDFHTKGGLRLTSAPGNSLVIKLLGSSAGFTTYGTSSENENRIGGAIQIVGAPKYPVVLTSLKDDSVCAGFDLKGRVMFDTNNDSTISSAAPGDWRSVKFDTYSNDRNVLVVTELEKNANESEDQNGTPDASQLIGYLASEDKAGDDRYHLGYEILGSIRSDKPNEADVYQFYATPGTEIWLDVDNTSRELDLIIEIVDKNGVVLARSDNSYMEEYGYGDVYKAAGVQAFTMNKDVWNRLDHYTVNQRDPGLRFIVPGPGNEYYIRVRSAIGMTGVENAVSGGTFTISDGTSTATITVPAFNPTDTEEEKQKAIVKAINDAGLSFVTARIAYIQTDNTGNGSENYLSYIVLDGVELDFDPKNSGLAKLANTSGSYSLQVRLQEADEVPGASVTYADIRYATNGIEAYGFPQHSPLQGEYIDVAGSAFATAADVGNLLESDKGTISVSGYMTTLNQVDWYKFDLNYRGQQMISGTNNPGNIWSAVFDIDYAGDSLARPDLTLWVFDSTGMLIYIGTDSNIADDQYDPTLASSIEKLSAGSVGPYDPFIGPANLPAGIEGQGGNSRTYYVAVTNATTFANVLKSAQTRIEPVDSVARIIEERVDQGQDMDGIRSAAEIETAQRLTLTPDEYSFSDVVTYVSNGGSIYMIDPYTGSTLFTRTYNGTKPGSTEIELRDNGKLYTLTKSGTAAPDFVEIDQSQVTNNTSSVSTNIRGWTLDSNNSPTIATGGFVPQAFATSDYGTTYYSPNIGTVGYTLAIGSLSGARYFGSAGNDNNVMFLLGPDGRSITQPPSGSPAYDAGENRNLASCAPIIQFSTLNGLEEPDEIIHAMTQGNDGYFYVGTNKGNIYRLDGSITQFGWREVDPQNAPRTLTEGSYTHITLTKVGVCEVDGRRLPVTGLAAGPKNVESELYRDKLFVVTTLNNTGEMRAFIPPQRGQEDTRRPIQWEATFFGGQDVVSVPANCSITFSTIDYNLWHRTSLSNDPVQQSPDNVRTNLEDGDLSGNPYSYPQTDYTINQSWYFGLEDPRLTNVRDTQPGAETYRNDYQTGNEASYNTYNVPGGAYGSLTSNSFSLDGYSPEDKPAIYFNYKTDSDATGTFSASEDLPAVFISVDGQAWTAIAVGNAYDYYNGNTTATYNAYWNRTNEAQYNENGWTYKDYDVHYIDILENDNQWRQAKVDLSQFAGAKDIRLKFVFSTAAGDIGLGTNNTSVAGTLIAGPVADQILDSGWRRDADTSVKVPAYTNADIQNVVIPGDGSLNYADNSYFTITGDDGKVKQFQFVNGYSIYVPASPYAYFKTPDVSNSANNNIVLKINGTDVPVNILESDSDEQLMTRIINTINGAEITDQYGNRVVAKRYLDLYGNPSGQMVSIENADTFEIDNKNDFTEFPKGNISSDKAGNFRVVGGPQEHTLEDIAGYDVVQLAQWLDQPVIPVPFRADMTQSEIAASISFMTNLVFNGVLQDELKELDPVKLDEAIDLVEQLLGASYLPPLYVDTDPTFVQTFPNLTDNGDPATHPIPDDVIQIINDAMNNGIVQNGSQKVIPLLNSLLQTLNVEAAHYAAAQIQKVVDTINREEANGILNAGTTYANGAYSGLTSFNTIYNAVGALATQQNPDAAAVSIYDNFQTARAGLISNPPGDPLALLDALLSSGDWRTNGQLKASIATFYQQVTDLRNQYSANVTEHRMTLMKNKIADLNNYYPSNWNLSNNKIAEVEDYLNNILLPTTSQYVQMLFDATNPLSPLSKDIVEDLKERAQRDALDGIENILLNQEYGLYFLAEQTAEDVVNRITWIQFTDNPYELLDLFSGENMFERVVRFDTSTVAPYGTSISSTSNRTEDLTRNTVTMPLTNSTQMSVVNRFTVSYSGPLSVQNKFLDGTREGSLTATRTGAVGEPIYRSQDNVHGGFYIDNIIVGFASRGEMVTNAPVNTNFDYTVGEERYIADGSYQLEIRRGTEFTDYTKAYRGSTDADIWNLININERQANGISFFAPDSSQIAHNQKFSISDGVNTLTFVFINTKFGGASSNEIKIEFSDGDSSLTIANKIKTAINNAFKDGRFKVTAVTGSQTSKTHSLVDLFNATDFLNLTENAEKIKHVIYGAVPGKDGYDYNSVNQSNNIIDEAERQKNGFYNDGTNTAKNGDKIGDEYVYYGNDNKLADFLNSDASRLYINSDLLTRTGDSNTVREKGQLTLFGNSITYSSDYAIKLEPGDNPVAIESQQSDYRSNMPLVPGIAIVNNVLAFNNAGGISIAGLTEAVPFVRIINNTIYGNTTAVGTGVNLGTNTAATLINNIFANLNTGVITSNGNETVYLANTYQGNNDNGPGAVMANEAQLLDANAPLFVNPARGNFYPQTGSLIIDSSAGNQAEREQWYIDAESKLGIPRSMIYAPDYDMYGQTRSYDTQSSSGGTGNNAAIDRGAIDRVDFERPRASLVTPHDVTDTASILGNGDQNAARNDVYIVAEYYNQFVIQLTDPGIGIDDLSVADEQGFVHENVITLKVEKWDGTQWVESTLVLGADYFANYNTANDAITLTPNRGQWDADARYTIILNNNAGVSESGIINEQGLVSRNAFTLKERKIVNGVLEERTLTTSNYLAVYNPAKNQILFNKPSTPNNNSDEWDSAASYILVLNNGEEIVLNKSESGLVLNNVKGGIIDLAGNTLMANRPADENDEEKTVFHVIFTGYDYGDAPDPIYPTLTTSDGPSHSVYHGYGLGNDTSVDYNPYASSNADGDDDDGVRLENDAFVAGEANAFIIKISDTNEEIKAVRGSNTTIGWLNIWIDWNGDGFNTSDEHIKREVKASDLDANGEIRIPVTPPSSVSGAISSVLTRVRFSSVENLDFTGYAPDGEVEDWKFEFVTDRRTFGDAPAAYTPTGQTDGWHSTDWVWGYDKTTGQPTLGKPVDLVPNSGQQLYLGTVKPTVKAQPNYSIKADGNGTKDDCVNFSNVFIVANETPTLDVTVTIPKALYEEMQKPNSTQKIYLSGWFDVNRDNVWGTDEYLIKGEAGGNGELNWSKIQASSKTDNPDGSVTVVVQVTLNTIPNILQSGESIARFRLSSQPVTTSYGPDFAAANVYDGDIEDFLIRVLDKRRDYGDAYGTTNTVAAQGGAVHEIIAGLQLGAKNDPELDGTPKTIEQYKANPVADNDGLKEIRLGIGGQSFISIDVLNATGADAYLNIWVDLNNDGDFDDDGERLVTNKAVSSQSELQTIAIALPDGIPSELDGREVIVGERFMRVRLSDVVNVGPTGAKALNSAGAPIGNPVKGEVEDYVVNIVTANGTITGTVYHDLNADGQLNEVAVNVPNVRLTSTIGPVAPFTTTSSSRYSESLSYKPSMSNRATEIGFDVEIGGKTYDAFVVTNKGALMLVDYDDYMQSYYYYDGGYYYGGNYGIGYELPSLYNSSTNPTLVPFLSNIFDDLDGYVESYYAKGQTSDGEDYLQVKWRIREYERDADGNYVVDALGYIRYKTYDFGLCITNTSQMEALQSGNILGDTVTYFYSDALIAALEALDSTQYSAVQIGTNFGNTTTNSGTTTGETGYQRARTLTAKQAVTQYLESLPHDQRQFANPNYDPDAVAPEPVEGEEPVELEPEFLYPNGSYRVSTFRLNALQLTPGSLTTSISNGLIRTSAVLPEDVVLLPEHIILPQPYGNATSYVDEDNNISIYSTSISVNSSAYNYYQRTSAAQSFGFTLEFGGNRYNNYVIYDNGTIGLINENGSQDASIVICDAAVSGTPTVDVVRGTSERNNSYVQIRWSSQFGIYIENDAAGDIISFFYTENVNFYGFDFGGPNTNANSHVYTNIGITPRFEYAGGLQPFYPVRTETTLDKIRIESQEDYNQFWVDTQGRMTFRTSTVTGLITNIEPGTSGVYVYLGDENGNPVKDANGNDVYTYSKQDGTYEFTGLYPGTYYVWEDISSAGKTNNVSTANNWIPINLTYEDTINYEVHQSYYEVHLREKTVVAGVNFGNFKQGTVSVSNEKIVEGNSGEKYVEVDVELTDVYGSGITVNYETSDGTATNGSDYRGTQTGTVTIGPQLFTSDTWNYQSVDAGASNGQYDRSASGDLIAYEENIGTRWVIHVYNTATGEDILLSDIIEHPANSAFPYSDRMPSIVQNENFVQLVWTSYEPSTQNYQVWYSYATIDDLGKLASNAMQVTGIDPTLKNANNLSPQISASSNSKNVYITWLSTLPNGQTEVYCIDSNQTADVIRYQLSGNFKRLTNNTVTETQVKIDGNHIVWVEENTISGQKQIMLYTIGESEQGQAVCISTGYMGMNVSPVISGDYIAWVYTSTEQNAASDILYYSIKENQDKPAGQKVVHSVKEDTKYTGYTYSYDENDSLIYDENNNPVRIPYVSYRYGVGATAPCVNGSWLVWQEPSSASATAKYDVIAYNLVSQEFRNVSSNNAQDDIAPQVVGNRLVWRANISTGTMVASEWVIRYIDLDVDSFIPITISPAFTYNYEPILTDKIVVWRSMSTTSNRYSITIATQTPATVHGKIQIPILGDNDIEDDETFFVTLTGVQQNGQYQLANLATDGQLTSIVTILNDDAGTDGFDFGDAPASYGTLLADDGARHVITGPALKPSTNSTNPSITAVDKETDGKPSTNADGDNNSTSNDENGIEFIGSWAVGNTVYFNAYVTEDCYLKAWFDWNHDGSFSDGEFGEEYGVFELKAGAEGNTIDIPIPNNAKEGKTYARFRVVSKSDYDGIIDVCNDNLKWYGSAMSGEVEDYTVTLGNNTINGNASYYVDNGTLVVKGTSGKDTITITRKSDSVELVDKAGNSQTFNVTQVRVDGIAGNVNIVGSDAKANKVVMSPYQTTVTEINGNFVINVLNAANINYIGKSGKDIVELYDSAGNDTVTLKPNDAIMTNGFYTNTVKGEGIKEVSRVQIVNGVERVNTVEATGVLGYITAYSTAGGEDQLELIGSAAADYVTSMGDMITILDDVSLDQATYYNRAKGFRNITVDAVENTETGANKNKLDSVSLFEKNGNNVHVELEVNDANDSASLTRGNDYQLLLNHFNTINATVLGGTDNLARLIGSESSDEELIATDTQVTWNGERANGAYTDYSVVLNNFANYTANAMGSGTALIIGSDANEKLIATDTQINWTGRQTSGKNYSLQAENFTSYSVDARGGRDEVTYTSEQSSVYARAHDNAMQIFALDADSQDVNDARLLELLAFENAELDLNGHLGAYKKGLDNIIDRLELKGNWFEEE